MVAVTPLFRRYGNPRARSEFLRSLLISQQTALPSSLAIGQSAPVEIGRWQGVLLVGIGVDLEGRRLAPLTPEYAER